MGKVCVVFGVLMTLLGVAAYVLSGFASVTALIPAFFGVPIAFLGVAAMRPRRVKFAGVAALALAFFGLVGSLGRIGPALARGEDITFNTATVVQLAFGGLALALLIVGTAALLKRSAGPPAPQPDPR